MNLDKPQPENNYPVAANGNLEELPEVKQLREKFLMIAEISDPLTREYKFSLLAKEAEQMGLSSESYRRLFETYLHNKEHIPQYPQKWWLLKEWVNWFLKFPTKAKLQTVLFNGLQKGILLTLAIGLFNYFQEASQKQKKAQAEAWQIINSAVGQKASGGRIEALEILNKYRVSLNNITLDYAELRTITLKNGKLAYASLKKADLGCNQTKCSIITHTNLYQADFQKAYLYKIDLRNSNLINANLTSTYLEQAKLQNANFNYANLEKAELQGAIFQGADLEGANFKDAIICGDVFDKSTESKKITCANFMGAKSLTATQIKSAKNWQNACYDLRLRKELNLPGDNPLECYKK